MLQKTIRGFTCSLLCVTMLASVADSNAQNDTNTPAENHDPQILLQNKLKYYRTLYPEILIMNLEGGVDFPADMVALDLVLGYRPMSLDYEHPAELREDLPGATHYAYACRHDSRRVRSSDDGEVRGTAARPILDRLEGQALEHSIIVVIRFPFSVSTTTFEPVVHAIHAMTRTIGSPTTSAAPMASFTAVLIPREGSGGASSVAEARSSGEVAMLPT